LPSNAGDAFETVRDHVVREATAQKVDEAIRTIVIDSHVHARSIIDWNRGAYG
jgi:hypothetical protein